MSAARTEAVDLETSGTILVVDDERNQRELLAGFLLGIGFGVCEAADGVQAVERVQGGGVDLVLLDQRMPRLGGIEAVQALRAADADVVVVVMTAYGSAEEASRAFAAGAVAYLGKPLDLQKLAAVIRGGLKQRGRRGSAGAPVSPPTRTVR